MKLGSWGCPGEEVLAAYMDGVLDDRAKNKTESHLANCASCRSLISDVVAMRRTELVGPPLGLEQRAIALTSPQRRTGRRILIPLTVGSVAALAFAAVLLRTPKKEISTILPSTVSSVGANTPVVAKSEPPSISAPNSSNLVRKGTAFEPVPDLIFPKEGGVLKSRELNLRWKLVPRALYYEIHLVDSEGEPVWQGESQTANATVPVTAAVKDGAYFVWIEARTQDGQVQKSSPVRFLVSSSR